jgi:hypothetical protein
VALVDDRPAVVDVDKLGDEHRRSGRGGEPDVGVELVAELVEDARQHGLLLGGEVAAGAVADGAEALLDRGEVGGGGGGAGEALDAGSIAAATSSPRSPPAAR